MKPRNETINNTTDYATNNNKNDWLHKHVATDWQQQVLEKHTLIQSVTKFQYRSNNLLLLLKMM